MSVDFDPMAIAPSSQGLPQDMSGSSDVYRHRSNRNSHPLTEREVEQGFNLFEKERGGMYFVYVLQPPLSSVRDTLSSLL